MNIKIGEIIKKLRRERDVTQEKLADYLGISYQAVSKWENGTALPDITLVVPIANFFDVSADELFSLNAQVNDAIPAEPAYYTSVFVNKMTHSTANTIKSTTETTREQFLKKLSDKNFAVLAGEPGFAALKQRLGQ